jgi:hypothetical protein
VSSVFACGLTPNCDGAKSYCVESSTMLSVCTPLPAECEQCQETHTCACLDPHLAPCDGGTLACAPKANGDQLWVLASGCH